MAENPDFKQPPWVQSPSEVMDWIDATHPTKKTKRDKHESSSDKVLRNLHVRFDLNVQQKKVPSSTIFSKFIILITGNGSVEEEFDLIPIADIVLRGFSKAKFKNLLKIVADGKTIFHYSHQHPDLRKTIDDFSSMTNGIHLTKFIEVTITSKEGMRSIATIKIMRMHKAKDHAVDIRIKGGIKENSYHTFKNYLSEKLGVEEVS